MTKMIVNVNLWPVDMPFDAEDDDDAIEQAREEMIQWANNLRKDDFTVDIPL